jgi:F-type H+-transporting ATPase subunit b
MIFLPVWFFSDSSSGIGALGLNAGDFIIQLITFILVFLVLRQWAFKPIVKVLRDRRKLIDDGVNLGLAMHKDKADMEKKVSQKLHNARAEADRIIASAEQQGRQLIQSSETSAKDKAESIIAAADDRIRQDTAKARLRLEKDLIGLVSEATEAIISEKIDADKDSALIEKALKSQADR